MNRGILVTAYATLKKDVSYEEVKAIYDSYYKNEKFVRVLDKDVCPETKMGRGKVTMWMSTLRSINVQTVLS